MDKQKKVNAQGPTIEELVVRLREIQRGLKADLDKLHQELETFRSEPQLSGALENAEKDAASRASDLEEEVKELHEQLKAVRDLLGLDIEKM